MGEDSDDYGDELDELEQWCIDEFGEMRPWSSEDQKEKLTWAAGLRDYTYEDLP